MHNELNPEAVFDAISRRRSMGLSRLKPDPVDRQLIERMLAAANWAPSHGDTEPWRFTVFAGQGRGALAHLFEQAQRDDAADNPAGISPEAAHKRAFAAPVWIALGVAPAREPDGRLAMTMEEEVMAVACAVQNLHIMACELGLAGMWHSKGSSVHPSVASGLGLNPPDRLLGLFMCGWPNSKPPAGERQPLDEKVRWVEQAPEPNNRTLDPRNL